DHLPLSTVLDANRVPGVEQRSKNEQRSTGGGGAVMNERRVPVLIVGAGLAGLSTAAFLGRHGVPALVVERPPGTSNQPKARARWPGTMEALKVLALARARVAASPSMKLTIGVAESLTGRVYREILVDAQPDFSALSPAGGAMASQELAEPLLAGRARELGA